MIPWLDENNPDQAFPDPSKAVMELNGLIALGGCLSASRLLRAYRHGIFPWYSDDDPICWWSPDPRTILLPAQFKLSRSLRKTLRRQVFQVKADCAFQTVIDQCAATTAERPETWITAEMMAAYCTLHEQGYAHSIEVYQSDKMVGGLYGVALGRIFYGESMFSRVSDASKVALAMLCAQLFRWQYALIDCQMPTAHLHRLGAQDIARDCFLTIVERYSQQQPRGNSIGTWQLDTDLSTVYDC